MEVGITRVTRMFLGPGRIAFREIITQLSTSQFRAGPTLPRQCQVITEIMAEVVGTDTNVHSIVRPMDRFSSRRSGLSVIR